MKLTEFQLIERLTRGLPVSERTVLGVGDDCAILRGSGGSEFLVTSDMLVEDVHFRRDTLPWPALGAKALTCGLSDVAAMGGRAQWAVTSLAVPDDVSERDVEALYQGLADQARRYHVDIVGGDTVRSPRGVAIDVTVIGRVGAGLALRRSGARAGEAVLLTGRVGEAAAGLDVLLHGDPERPDTRSLVLAHQWPTPRRDVGVELPMLGTVGACIDVSDGLAGDLGHVCAASGLGAVVYEEAIPMSDAMQAYAHTRRREPLDWALGGGEDYELLFTMPERAGRALVERWGSDGPAAVRIVGEMRAGAPEVWLRRRSGVTEPMPAAGFDHFRTGA